jgi:fumarylacetoacetate (FAA) hydrolase
MKLATLHDGSRDGQLVVVSRDLAQAHFATGIATRLQQLLDDWNFISPQLEDLYATLNGGKARHAFAFEPRHCMAPLPRAYQRVDACAYPSHLERLHRARGAEVPDRLRREPLMARRRSDHFLGPCEAAVFADEEAGIDFGAGIAVITGDVAPGASPEAALDGVRLLMLANDWRLRHLDPSEAAPGAGLLQSPSATAFGPVAVTPDELGGAWRGGRVLLDVEVSWNGRRVGRCSAGDGMHFHFGQLVAHLARTRPVGAGSIVGGGTVSQDDTARGFGCIAEQRATETLDAGAPTTGYLRFGDRVRIEMTGPDGLSIFGAIEQPVAAPAADAR